MSHSPFPWSTHPQVPTAVFDADGTKVANTLGPNAEDNAALIAAIPAMIEALQKVRSYNVDISAGRINYRPHDHIQVIDAVLASIGKTP